MNSHRRKILAGLVSTPLITALPGLSFAASSSQSKKRFVLVILRGAMDGLAAVQPYGDTALSGLRDSLLVKDNELLKLDSFFALHPSFSKLFEMYNNAELLVHHAVASPYRERSHFDAQNVLEIGLSKPDPGATGWLNRAVPFLSTPQNAAAMAIGQAVPHVLLGESQVGSWAPAVLPMPSDSTMDRIAQLYNQDEFLGAKLDQALMAAGLVEQNNMSERRSRGQNFNVLINATARFMREEGGPQIAVLENNGWDTHANQGSSQGQLARKFSELDTGLAALKTGLGEAWQDTLTLVVTEFGRTAASNGTGGTDHGTGSVAFMLGGSVGGGQVRSDWPGLSSGNLHAGRDLRATTDMRTLFKAVLQNHLQIQESSIDSLILPV